MPGSIVQTLGTKAVLHQLLSFTEHVAYWIPIVGVTGDWVPRMQSGCLRCATDVVCCGVRISRLHSFVPAS